MTTLAPSTDYTGPAVTQGGKKTFIATMRQFIADCLGTDSTPRTVRGALGASDSPFRSRIFNGNCYEDHRNSGAAQTIVAAAALAYCIDRFYAYCTGANVTGQQITAADGTKRYRYTGAASVTGIGHGHRIEAANSLDMAGNTCTMSVKLSNSLLTTVSWAAYYANSIDTFGTLAAPTRTAIASGTFTISSTEVVYSAQMAVPAGATTGIEIVWSVGAQTSGTWTIGELQFEKGLIAASAINFERVDVGINKTRCQRYLPAIISNSSAEVIGVGQCYSTTQARIAFRFPVDARVVPTGAIFSSGAHQTVTNAGASGVAGASASIANVGLRNAWIDVSGSSGLVAGNATMGYLNTPGAYILFTGCEL